MTDNTISLEVPRTRRERGATAWTALFGRAFRDARVRTIGFGYVFAAYSWLQATGYRSAYPSLSDRVAFARSFAGNDAIRLFYGYPYDVLTVGGYSAWRVGGTLALAAAAFGVLGAVSALRGEEEAGRTEMVLAGVVGRRASYLSPLSALAVATVLLWTAELAGFVVARLPVGGSAYLALATVSLVPVFAGIGALASQLAPTRRMALSMAALAVAAFWLLRVVSDTWAGGAWLRWATPLGWAEQLRPFAKPDPIPLLLMVATTVVLVAGAGRLWVGRDVGRGVLVSRDRAAPRWSLLASPMAQALRVERGPLAAWGLGVTAFSAVLGMISTSVSTAGISKSIQKDIAKFGVGSIVTPTGYLAFVFIVFILAMCLFVCSQVGSARQEEAAQRLETLLANPVGRYRWLGGRLVLTGLAAVALSLAAGLLTWAGAASQGVAVSLPRMLEAGANCLPAALLFLGIAALAYAVVPRWSAVVSYGLVVVAFLWYATGALIDVPRWLIDLTPFQHIGLVPARPFDAGAALVMILIGLASGVAALVRFRRRDLLGT